MALTEIKIVPAYSYQDAIRFLFAEYTDLLIAGDSSFKQYLDIQHYDDELDNLEMKYGPPFGRLYLALCAGEAAGCIGLRRIDEASCEMKRLYVRPRFRGQGIARRLVSKLMSEAAEIGYSHMLLDTLPFLRGAICLYESFGFCETECYNDSPMSTSIYMRADL